jgi:hypothetical protein
MSKQQIVYFTCRPREERSGVMIVVRQRQS